MFTTAQIKQLVHRLRQTPEELLNDKTNKDRLPYNHKTRDGATILGVAHCDYVRSAWSYPTLTKTTDGNDAVVAGQVDDRVGVWLLLDILPGLIPTFDVLLTDDEEIGRSTAQNFGEDMQDGHGPQSYNWTFQFDRRGTDFVDYGKASQRFIKNFKKATGIAHGMGSFSDICYLPDSCGSKVNIGTGYYNEHSPTAHVDLQKCFDQVTRFSRFANKFAGKQFHAPKDRQDDWFLSDFQLGRKTAKKVYKLSEQPLVAAKRALDTSGMHKCQMCETYTGIATSDGLCDECHFKVYGEDLDLQRKGYNDVGATY